MVSKNYKIPRNKTIGQIFTPDYVAEFMVRNVINIIKNQNNFSQNLKVLEPAGGEGIFLKHLIENKFMDITAYELDLSLKDMLLNTFPTVNFRFDNFLGSEKSEKFDIIIGNPPYLGQNYNADIFQDYISKYPTCAKYFVGNMDLFYFFIHMAIEKLNPGGLISYITTNYWVTKSQKTGIKFLKPHILDECFLLQYTDLSCLNIFEGAKGQHNCIFFLQKKTEQEKLKKKNKDVQIVQILGANTSKKSYELLNKRIFEDLNRNTTSPYIRMFNSALTNNDLKPDENWNLIYPKQVKSVVDKIENYCRYNGNIMKIKDFFIIRNGLILINDNIFILRKENELKFENNGWFLKINGSYTKLSETEQSRLKKVYKSKSIKQYGYDYENNLGYIIYLNKNEFKNHTLLKRNKLLEQKYPALTKYLKQFEIKLREILINAKENPDDFYFPRRGSFIRTLKEDGKEQLLDLEPLYDNEQKIFFKYISNENVFGYSHNPYYATSDTYFLWPVAKKKIDYLFTLAYLNSKLVSFLYKAKNINIKRSKTKLEHGIPMPNLKNFETSEKSAIVDLIKTLTYLLVNKTDFNLSKDVQNFYSHKLNTNHYSPTINSILKLKNKKVLENDEVKIIQNTIDKLFFELFNLDEIALINLLNKYYFLSIK
ncbi:MAG: Eco57I restriction-modification methylase domain-containing protein [Promethearchaeota archaeon]|jgi:adenine-specific DNA-methyltransferase